MLTPTNNTAAECGTTPPTLAQYSIFPGPGFPKGTWYFQPWGVAIGNANTSTNPDNIIVGNQNGNYIFSMNITGAWSNPSVPQNGNGDDTNVTGILYGMTNRPISIAADPEGNIYFVEDANNGGSNGGKYLPGVYQIPASAVAADIATAKAAGVEWETALSSDCPVPALAAGSPPPTGSSCLTRVDPNLPNVTGVVTDAAGNLYISDGSEGVFMVPNPSGTPAPSDASLLTTLPTQGEVAVDPARKILYVPTTKKQSNGQADVAKVGIGYAEFGGLSVGTTTATNVPVEFDFNSSVTPANFTIVETGMTTPEFSITGGTCTTGSAYAALSSCTENLNFTPAAVGSTSARLLMLDAESNILASILLHGTGLGADAQAAPGVESTIGSTLKTPTQVTTDALGNVYVADPGLKEVVEYAAGSSTAAPIGTGSVTLAAPTGVAVDGAGDVFIADSGNVYEVPFGPSGLNASGIVALQRGLGSNLSLAADGLGDLYVADPSNRRVARVAGIGDSSSGALVQSTTMLTSGFTAPSAVAVDSNNNLFVSDGTNLFELQGGLGTTTTVLSSLSGVTGLAVDPSGAVYFSSTSGTERIAIVGGVAGSASVIAPDVTSSSSVALDRSGNVYVTPAAGPGVRLVSTTGIVNIGNPGSLPSTITNIGNTTLSITGYTDYSFVLDSVTITNFTGADGSPACVGGSPIAAGDTCQVVVTFAPESGQQGALTGWVQATSNAINAPITIDATGNGPALTNSTVQVTVGSGPQVISTSLTVTVSPKSGAGVTPTGTVQVSYPSWTVVVPSTCASAPCAPTINQVTVTAALPLINGVAQFTGNNALAPVLAGPQTFTVGYTGDRVYGESTGSTTANVAKSSIAGFIADSKPPSYLPFVEEGNPPSSVSPYDGTQLYWTYSMPVTVNTAIGIPTGTITFNDNSAACPTGTSASGVGAAICLLANYSGIACPQSLGSGAQYVVNNTNYSSATAGATATFGTSCLQMPEFTTYTPVVSTHYITPVYSGDANFNGATDPVSTLFQALAGPLVNITPTAPAAPSVPIGDRNRRSRRGGGSDVHQGASKGLEESGHRVCSPIEIRIAAIHRCDVVRRHDGSVGCELRHLQATGTEGSRGARGRGAVVGVVHHILGSGAQALWTRYTGVIRQQADGRAYPRSRGSGGAGRGIIVKGYRACGNSDRGIDSHRHAVCPVQLRTVIRRHAARRVPFLDERQIRRRFGIGDKACNRRLRHSCGRGSRRRAVGAITRVTDGEGIGSRQDWRQGVRACELGHAVGQRHLGRHRNGIDGWSARRARALAGNNHSPGRIAHLNRSRGSRAALACRGHGHRQGSTDHLGSAAHGNLGCCAGQPYTRAGRVDRDRSVNGIAGRFDPASQRTLLSGGRHEGNDDLAGISGRDGAAPYARGTPISARKVCDRH